MAVEDLLCIPHMDLNKMLPNGQTPFCIAAMIGNTKIMGLLLATKQVDVNSQDRYGRTPLSWAAGPCFPGEKRWVLKLPEEERVSNIQALLDCPGIDHNIVDSQGHSPAWWARTYNSLLHCAHEEYKSVHFGCTLDTLRELNAGVIGSFATYGLQPEEPGTDLDLGQQVKNYGSFGMDQILRPWNATFRIPYSRGRCWVEWDPESQDRSESASITVG
jgi:hypothetical protein